MRQSIEKERKRMDKSNTETSNTPNYVSALLMPHAESKSDRRVWSVPLLGVWVPFFTATNAAGETDIGSDVLGAPIRLQKNQDGTPKFSKNGKPVLRTVKELSDQIRLVRDNFTFGLMAYAENVRKTMPAEYKAQVEAAENAGAPITKGDGVAVMSYLEQLREKAEAAAHPAPQHQEERVLVPA